MSGTESDGKREWTRIVQRSLRDYAINSSQVAIATELYTNVYILCRTGSYKFYHTIFSNSSRHSFRN